jgi:hypothetical protein
MRFCDDVSASFRVDAGSGKSPFEPCALSVWRFLHRNFQIQDRRAVDRLERVDVNGRGRIAADDGDAMKPDRVGPIGRARGEHSRQRNSLNVHRVDLQGGAVSFMEPGHHDQLNAGNDTIQCRREPRIDLEGRLRRSFERLAWGVLPIAKGRSNDPDWSDLDRRRHRRTFSPLRRSHSCPRRWRSGHRVGSGRSPSPRFSEQDRPRQTALR